MELHAQARVAVPFTWNCTLRAEWQCHPHCHSTSSARAARLYTATRRRAYRNGALRPEWQCELERPLHESGLFRGSCGLTPRRRRQPSGSATRAESAFPTKREGPARRCRRHAMAAEALVPSDAARVAIRIATRVATVYTNTLKWYREAILGYLCTLLRSQGHPPTRTHEVSEAGYLLPAGRS